MLDFAQASGTFGTPTLTLKAPVYVDHTTYTDTEVGTGRQITSDAQDVVFSIAIANGATGQSLVQAAPPVQPLSSWHSSYEGLVTAMMCAAEGTRVVAAIPARELSAAGAQDLGVTDDQSIAVAIDIKKVYLAAADGTPQYNDRRGMPSVVLAPGGRPGVIVPDAAAPSDRVVEVLKKGDGPQVGSGDTARVQYTGVDWNTRKVTNSTWENGASIAVAPNSDLAFASDLSGMTVGSQLLVVAPSSDGDATIYVVDLLGIDDPAATR